MFFYVIDLVIPSIKNKIVSNTLRFEAKANKFIYFSYQTFIAQFSKRSISILFSENNEREEDIKKSFRLLRHKVSFGKFSYENVKKNDLVIPLTIDDIRLLDSYPELAKRNPIPNPTLRSLDICDDKYLFYTTLVEKGFENYLPKVGKDLRMPYIVKKKIAHMGMNCYVIDTPEKQEQYKSEINDPDYFCQEIVQGQKEYATHFLYIGGKVVRALNMIYIFPTPTYVKGRDKFICNRLGSCPHTKLFGDILDAIGYEGLCCFNYKEIDGKPYVFEINPRFGSSLAMFFFSYLKNLKFPTDNTHLYKENIIDPRLKQTS